MFAFCIATCLFICQTGCSAPGIPVQLTPTHSDKTLGITFTRAYYAPTQSGEDRIVLVSDPIDEPVTAGPGKPLPQLQSPPVWYVLLIDLHWRTAPLGNLDSPVASNAALHWYVLGTTTDQATVGEHTGVLHYSGTGSAWVTTGNDGANVRVQSGEMALADQHGPLFDPFKSFQMRTEFHASTDNQRLDKVMQDVHRAITVADGGSGSRQE